MFVCAVKCCCCCKNVCIVYECYLNIKLRHQTRVLYNKLSDRFATLSFICNEIFLNVLMNLCLALGFAPFTVS